MPPSGTAASASAKVRSFQLEAETVWLKQSAEPIADYETTAGRFRKENNPVHGRQPGDPVKAAQAIIAAVEAEKPPSLLLLGQDALTAYRSTAAARASEVEAWETVSAGTGLDE